MPVWTLSKAFTFEAAHQLPAHDGKCQRLHGHSWRGVVEVRGTSLHPTGPQRGMVVDYGVISACVEALVDRSLDHYFLNESTGLTDPTSECVAQWIYDQLAPCLANVSAVTVEETCTSSARYEP